MLSITVIVGSCVAVTRADSTPPVIESGWNLASTPCDITVAEVLDKLNLDSIKVFAWKDGRYVAVDTLKRGVGYAVNSDRNMDTAGLCNVANDSDPITIEFKEGWNLMGNPYHGALAFTEAFRDEAENVADMIFEYKNGRYSPLLKTDKIRVWQGVWIYSFAKFNLNYDYDCEKLTINLIDGATVLNMGESAVFNAICLMNDVEYDVTDSVKWSLSAPEALKASEKDGTFTAVAAGDCSVSASLDNVASDPVKMTVLKPVPVLRNIIVNAEKTDLSLGESTVLTVNGTYSDDSTADITGEAEFTVSNTDVGSVSEAIFTAAGAGETEIGAAVGDIVSEPILVKVTIPAPTLTSITIKASKTGLFIGDSAELSVTGAYSDNTTADLTSEAALTLSSTRVGRISGAIFTAIAAGTTSITAKVGGMTSAPVRITVTAAAAVIREVRMIVVPQTIEIHQSAYYQVFAIFSDGTAYDVTREAQLEYDSGAGRAENGVFYPARMGEVVFFAKYNSITSEPEKLTVMEKKLIWIGLFPEPYPPAGVMEGATVECPDYLQRTTECVINPLKPLPCPKGMGYLSCYSNNYIPIGATGKFTAMADYNNNTYRYGVESEIEKWDVQDTSILSVAEGGIVTAYKNGRTGIRAYMDGVWSEWSWVQVVDDGTQSFLMLEFSNKDTIVKTGGTTTINATYYTRIPAGAPGDPYVVHGNIVDIPLFKPEMVTGKAFWSLGDTTVGKYEPAKATFTGLAAGVTGIHAEYGGAMSNSAELEVWKPSEITFCNADQPNEATWTDNLTVAQLDTDCDEYGPGENVTVSFSALLSDYQSRGALDVCLDLFILDSNQNIVKTFRNTNCSPTSLSRAIDGYTPVYEYSVVWDRTDDTGQTVPIGKYTATARFYILYYPILKLDFQLTN